MNEKILKYKYLNKKSDAQKRGLDFKLTLDEYKQLIVDANIQPEHISPRGYHLSRYDDMGNYEIGNCRFIPYLENVKERTYWKIITDGERSIRNKKISNTVKNNKVIQAGTFTGKHHTIESKEKIGEKTKITSKGERNSQFGLIWIYNIKLKESKKIKKEELVEYLNDGWLKGRKINF